MDPEVQEKRGFFSKIPGKLRWLIVALVFNNVAIGYLLVYLTAFFPELGINASVVGLLLGLEGAMVLLSIPLGILSDRRGAKEATPDRNLSSSRSYHNDRPHDQRGLPGRCRNSSWNRRIRRAL